MNLAPTFSVNRWIELQTELRDLAFVLDRKGNPAAADVAATIAVRIGELLTEETRADHRAESPGHPAVPVMILTVFILSALVLLVSIDSAEPDPVAVEVREQPWP